MLRTLDRVAAGLARLAAIVGTIGLLVEVGVILTDIVGRELGMPLKGNLDIQTMSLVLIVFGGMALCDRTGGHVAVDIFESRFSPGMIRAGDIFSALLGAAVFLALAWTIHESAQLSLMLNLSTNIINLPKAWFQYAVVVLSVVTAIGMMIRALSLCSGRDTGRGEPPA